MVKARQKPTVVAFANPVILNLNKLIEQNVNYTLDLYNSSSESSEILRVYKSERDNTVVINDQYTSNEIRIKDNRKINLLIIWLDYNPYPDTFDVNEIQINKYEVIEFDKYIEESEVVIVEPLFTFHEGYICDYCEDYHDENDYEDVEPECECTDNYLEMLLMINGVNNNPNINDIMNSKTIVYFTDNMSNKFYILSEQGIHTGEIKYKITEELTALFERKRTVKELSIEETISLGELTILICYNLYNYNIKITFDLANHRIIIKDPKVIKGILNKELIGDFIKYLNLVEKFSEDIGFHRLCTLEEKEILKFIPNELLRLIKFGVHRTDAKNFLLAIINLDDIDEMVINIRYKRQNEFNYELDDNIVQISLGVSFYKFFEPMYNIKLSDLKLIKKFINYLLNHDEFVSDSYWIIKPRKNDLEKLLEL